MTDSTQDAAPVPWTRVRIQGTLTLQTPLVLKNGAARAGSKLKDGSSPEVMQVHRTRDGRAAIPGSSLKGVLRSEIERLGDSFAAPAFRDLLFGKRSAEKTGGEGSPDQGRGGAVEFGFALSRQQIEDADDTVEHVVAIDRVRRAAADRLLFATETIPAGMVFDICLVGYGLTRGHVEVLLSALQRFNDSRRPLALGSATASHYGRATWSATSVQTLSADELQAWTDTPADQPQPDVWTVAKTEDALKSFVAVSSAPSWKTLTINVTLAMDGWFLVRDPRLAKAATNAAVTNAADGRRTADQKPPDALPRCVLKNGVPHVCLPARSVRGVLRSQVERIARTLAPSANVKPGPLKDDSGSPAQSLVAALFGGVGGRTALAVDTFVDPHPAEVIVISNEAKTRFEYPVVPSGKTSLWLREFVAVDRFTGGAAEHLKFNCQAAWKPQLKGTLSIDLDDLQTRCRATGASPAAVLGLFLLALRDLKEGDLSFGMGAAKGWGRAEDALLRTSVADHVAEALEKFIGGAPTGLPRPTGAFQLFDDAWFRAIASTCVRAARAQLPTAAGVTP